MEGFAGETVMETSVATLSDAEPPISPAVAATAAVPPATAVARPAGPIELATAAAEGFEDVQMTDWRVCGLPSLKVPIATNCWVCPGIRNALAGVTAMETRPDGV